MTAQRTPSADRRLRAALASSEPLLRAMSESDAARHPGPEKWSPKQIIGHLIDSASNNHQRFVRAVWQADLVFSGYEQEKWVELQRYQETAWAELLTFWGAYNRHLATVMASVPDEPRRRIRWKHNLDEIATHAPPTPEQATLEYFMQDYVDHLELHLRQILGKDWKPAATG